MDELMNLIAANERPSQISHCLKDILYAKSADKIEAIKPKVASSMFGLESETEE